MTKNWRCRCGKSHNLSDRFCDCCGEEINSYTLDGILREETEDLFVKKGILNSMFAGGTQYNICPSCRSSVTVGSRFCSHCGKPIQAVSMKMSKNSKIIATILAFTLGCFGAHNFYLKYYKRAIPQLIITWMRIVTGAFFFKALFVMVMLWAIIEGILIISGEIKKNGDGIALV